MPVDNMRPANALVPKENGRSHMEITELQQNWDAFGRADPFWAILTDPSKKNGKWDAEEFFQTGKAEIANAMAYVNALPVRPNRNRALDFGCGVGRLTQALCEHFHQACGVDIAPS